MSAVTRDQFDGRIDQEALDTKVNALLVPILDFSKSSDLAHRFFGCITGAADGEREWASDPAVQQKSPTKDRFVINPCLRFQYAKISDRVQVSLENELGYLLTERYITEDIPYAQAANYIFHTKYPGVEKLNVALV